MPLDPARFTAELARLAALSPPFYFMGGVAEEALLDRHLSPHHADVDVLALSVQWARQGPALSALGFAPAPGAPVQPAAGRPALLCQPTGSLRVEVWLAAPAPLGDYALDLPGQPPARPFRLRLPADTFAFPPIAIAGYFLHTVSPLALYLLRAASALTRGTPEQRERDRAVQVQLRRAFLAGYPEMDLQPGLKMLYEGDRAAA